MHDRTEQPSADVMHDALATATVALREDQPASWFGTDQVMILRLDACRLEISLRANLPEEARVVALDYAMTAIAEPDPGTWAHIGDDDGDRWELPVELAGTTWDPFAALLGE